MRTSGENKRRRRHEPEIITIPCEFCACKHQATHHPKICVPVKGWSIEMHAPLTVIVGLKLCKDHALKFNAHDMLTMTNDQGLRMQDIFVVMAHKKVVPDFDRVYMLALPIDAEEVIAMDRQEPRF